MNNLAFKFYSIIKNEDVPPYLGENFLLCADGLGGDGSTVHEIDREKHPDLKAELFESAFGDIGKEELAFCEDYIDSLLSEMADEKSDTSAMWGSRIATVRFAYALTKAPEGMADISNAKDRENIAEFVHKGLVSVKKHFDLEVADVTGKLPLPTTMCAIKYEDKGEYVLAESIWAGDSRCYYISENGLKCASIDDEGSSGGITNLFDALDDTVTTLNYKKFEIKKPCVLLTASDGIFDTFKPSVSFRFEPENFGVEAEILSHVMKASSPDEASKLLHDCYNTSHRGDDSTLCFVPFGVDSYEELKAWLKPRADKICKLYEEYVEKTPQLYSLSADEKSLESYVRQRTRDKFPDIIDKLVKLYNEGSDDIALSSDFNALLDEQRANIRTSLLGKRSGALASNFDKLETEIRENPQLAILPKKDSSDKDCIFKRPAFKCISDLSSRAKDFIEKKADLEKREKAIDALLPSIKLATEELSSACKTLYSSLVDEGCLLRDESFAKRLELFGAFSTCLRSINNGISGQRLIDKIPPIKGVELAFSHLVSAVNKTISATNNAIGDLNYGRTQHKNALKAFESALGIAMSQIKDPLASVDTFLTEKAIRHYNLSTRVSPEEIEDTLKSELGAILARKELTERVVDCVVCAFRSQPSKASLLDGSYNEARLKRFKEYHINMTSPREEIESLEKEIMSAIDGYMSDIKED